VRFIPMFGRQSYKLNGKHHFYGGVNIEAVGGGYGLVDQLLKAAERNGIEIRYATRMTRLLQDRMGTVTGVTVKGPEGFEDLTAKSVVLACGGFEANPEMRVRYLGPGWEHCRVRGTRHNTGDGIKAALDIGAQAFGGWSTCHAVAWDISAPPYGDRVVLDNFQKHSYPIGIVVNLKGERFVDEGADFRNHTYAKYGREIMKQPMRTAVQIFDQRTIDMVRDEYRIRQVTKVAAGTLEELVRKLEDVDAQAALEEILRYNAAVKTEVPFNPNVKDGRGTTGLAVNKSNWANTLDEPPFEAYAVTCGITFTFGGLRINTDAQVISTDGEPIPGLYAAGELVGGIFYFNYPGGSGLTNGAVFGRIAGASAARSVGSAA
jgi:tricarballylate dehydrogenase